MRPAIQRRERDKDARAPEQQRKDGKPLMQMIDPRDVPNIDPENIRQYHRLQRLIATIERSETYDHAFVFHFCGTPGCACGHFLADPELRSDFLHHNPDIDLPRHRSPIAVSPQVMKRVATALGIPWRIFDDPSPHHDGTKAGVISCLKGYLRRPLDRGADSPSPSAVAIHV